MPRKEFKDRGVITKIYLKDFVTYKEVAITPGRNLNVIIGPNGTGKSTLVSAIGLGLCGNVKLLGKQGSIAQYVRTGSEKATIQIDLQESHTKTVQLSRIFTVNNKSTWMINGKAVEEKKVKEVIMSMNIQVDNLCQFLPQEKVKNFSEMDGKTLLQNTEKSIGNPKLYEYHVKLIEDSGKHANLENEIAQSKSLLDVQTQKCQGLEGAVSGIREKKATKKRITTLKQKRAWITYDLSRKNLTEAKKESNQVADDIKSLKATLEPVLKNKEIKEGEIKKLKGSQAGYNNKVYKSEAQFKKILEEIEKDHVKIREIRKETKHEIELEKNRENELSNAEAAKNKLANDLSMMMEEYGTKDMMQQECDELTAQLDEKRRLVETLTSEFTTIKQKFETNQRNISNYQREQCRLQDVESKRLEILQTKSPEAYRGVMWLRQNKDKFRASVHEPMLLSIQVKNEGYAKFFENIIGFRDLIAFVCEDKDDMNLLLTCLREQQNLVINVVHCDSNKPYNRAPRIPLEQIRRLGFQDYLVSLLDAPATIMKFLITMYNIHNIPIGSNLVEDNMENIPAQIGCYFSPNNMYSTRFSKYTGDRSTRTSRINKAQLLSMVVDTTKIQMNENIVKDLERQQSALKAQMQPVEEAITLGSNEVTTIRNHRQKVWRDIQQLGQLQTRITLSLKKIQQIEDGRKNIADIKASGKARIVKIINKQIEMYNQSNLLFEQTLKTVKEDERMSVELSLMQRELVAELNASRDLREQLEAAQAKFKELDTNLQPMKKRVDEYFAAALQQTGGLSPQDTAQFKKYQIAFAKLPQTIEEINVALKTNQARVYCLNDDLDADHVLTDYENTKKQVQELGVEIQEKTEEMESLQREIAQLRVQWLPVLKALVEQINTKFSQYFTTLGCVGEVSLGYGQHELDFNGFEMKIKVKFRDADDLQEFTKQRQSGGERSVTTAIYMMALQELTIVPFRCVDEINQGMDATNERRIFDLIVDITSKPGSSQYFLLTPKLLPDLHYSDFVRVHCVFNGPYILPSNRFNMTDYCARIAARREKADAF